MQPGNDGKPVFLANHAGGVAGGIATGQPVVVRIALKPTSSILTPVETITRDGDPSEIKTKGRHDPCVGIRAAPVADTMMALVLADQKLLHRAQTGRGSWWRNTRDRKCTRLNSSHLCATRLQSSH